MHDVYYAPPAAFGVLGTFRDELGWRFVPMVGKSSDFSAEIDFGIFCRDELGVSDATIRVKGFNTYLAIARSADGNLGWASYPVRAIAEVLAAKGCGDRKVPWVYSIHTKSGEAHNHYQGDPHCQP